jgi:hypothetical protein
VAVAARVMLGLAMAACTGSPVPTPAPTATDPGSTARSTASLNAGQTAQPSPPATTSPLPSGVAWIADRELAAGTYWFNGFEPWLELTVPSDGWEVGHFHPEFFDLFHAGDFPSIGFGRFAAVKHRDGTTFESTDAQSIVAALRTNPELEVIDVGPAAVAGLTGLTIDIRAKSPQTPLFTTPGGDFNFDPEFLSRWQILDVPDGAIEILVAARPGHLEDAIATTQPILDSVRIVGP